MGIPRVFCEECLKSVLHCFMGVVEGCFNSCFKAFQECFMSVSSFYKVIIKDKTLPS